MTDAGPEFAGCLETRGLKVLQKGTNKPKFICATALTPSEMSKEIWTRSIFRRWQVIKKLKQQQADGEASMYGDATQQEKPQCQAGLGRAIFKVTVRSSFGAPKHPSVLLAGRRGLQIREEAR